MSNPLVSICIPCYNAGKYIEETLKCLIDQTYRNIEIIVVDDDSTDNSASIIHGIKDSRIKYYKQENKGAGAARNMAFHNSTGELIKFMDADDLITPDLLAKQVEAHFRDREAIVSAGWGRFYNDDLRTFVLVTETVWRDMDGLEWILESWSQGPNTTQPGIFLIPRNIIVKYGGWIEELSLGPNDDMEFYTRIIVNSRVVFANGGFLQYRSGLSDSLSRIRSENAMAVCLDTIKLACKSVIKREDSSRAKWVCSLQIEKYIHLVYPHYFKLYRKALSIQQSFGPCDAEFTCGGYTKVLSSLFGWKTAKWCKFILGYRQ